MEYIETKELAWFIAWIWAFFGALVFASFHKPRKFLSRSAWAQWLIVLAAGPIITGVYLVWRLNGEDFE